MRVWRPSYNPFAFGNCHRNISTTISDNLKKEDIGLGFKAVVIEYGNKTYVFEVESGGLVGNSLEDVREDIKACGNVELMKKQVYDATLLGAKAVEVSFEEFFK